MTKFLRILEQYHLVRLIVMYAFMRHCFIQICPRIHQTLSDAGLKDIPKSRPSYRWKTLAIKWTLLITHWACQIPQFARRHFHYISLNENVNISIQISLNYVTDDPIDNKATLVQIMAQSWTDDKPSPEGIMTKFIVPHVVTLTVASCTRSALHEKKTKTKKKKKKKKTVTPHGVRITTTIKPLPSVFLQKRWKKSMGKNSHSQWEWIICAATFHYWMVHFNVPGWSNELKFVW